MTEEAVPASSSKLAPRESEYIPDPDKIMNVALGPQHPGAGHFRIRLWLDGDYLVRADPDPGYVHRG